MMIRIFKFLIYSIILLINIPMMARNIELPDPQVEGGLPIMDVLNIRKSSRDFSEKEIDLQTLSNLLWASFGYNRDSKRTAPSSHNRQEIEIYVSLKTGTYIYDAKQNVLTQINNKDLRQDTGLQNFVGEAPLNLIFVADTSKITGKTPQGVIEATFANTGYISQNTYLFSASVGLNTVARAMVDRDALAKKLNLSPSQIITLCQTIGWPNMKKTLNVPKVEVSTEYSYESLYSLLKDKGVKASIDVVNWKEYSYAPPVSFSIMRSNTHLFISFVANEKSIRAVNTEYNSPVWEDSCVEFFMQVPSDEHYYNFEMNCIGTLLAAKRRSKTDCEHFSAEKLDQVICFSSLEKKPFEEKDSSGEWSLVVGIPFEMVGLDGENLPKSINANFYKCADATSTPHYLSWNPIPVEQPNFHLPEFFGVLNFE